MATAVQIEITLDDAGVVTGAQRVNSALSSIGTDGAEERRAIERCLRSDGEAERRPTRTAVKRFSETGQSAFKKYLDSERAASGRRRAAEPLAGAGAAAFSRSSALANSGASAPDSKARCKSVPWWRSRRPWAKLTQNWDATYNVLTKVRGAIDNLFELAIAL
jgi:hypothetical protein